MCGFGLATKRVWTGEQGDKKERVQYHQIVAWSQLAELCHQLLHKGSRTYVEGRLVTREYEKDGDKRTITEVVIDDMILLDARSAEKPTKSTRPHSPPVMSLEPASEEDLPF